MPVAITPKRISKLFARHFTTSQTVKEVIGDNIIQGPIAQSQSGPGLGLLYRVCVRAAVVEVLLLSLWFPFHCSLNLLLRVAFIEQLLLLVLLGFFFVEEPDPLDKMPP